MSEIIPQTEKINYLTDFIDKTQINSINSTFKKDAFLDYYSTLPKKLQNDKLITSNKKKNLKDCGSYLLFRDYYRISKVKLHTANFCGIDKLCPFCASRRAYKQQTKIEQYLDTNKDLLSRNWFYIVLPVKHEIDETLETVFNRLRTGLKKIRFAINNNKSSKGKTSFFSQFDGLFYSIETTYSQNGWNVHVNILACSSVPFDYDLVQKIDKNGKKSLHSLELSLEWEKYTGSYIHNISRLDFQTPEDIRKNLLEIFKYSVKFSELKSEYLYDFYSFTQSKRLLGAMGCFYGLKLDVLLKGDFEPDTEFIEYLYQRFNDKDFIYSYKGVVQK